MTQPQIKRSLPVRAFRTETGHTAKDELMSTLEVVVPAEEVKFLRDMHRLQDVRPVAYTVRVTERETGEARDLSFHSKGSKMKEFVPVQVLLKASEPTDDLNALFDGNAYEVTLDIEVIQEKAPLFEGMQKLANQDGVESVTVSSGGTTIKFENQGRGDA